MTAAEGIRLAGLHLATLPLVMLPLIRARVAHQSCRLRCGQLPFPRVFPSRKATRGSGFACQEEDACGTIKVAQANRYETESILSCGFVRFLWIGQSSFSFRINPMTRAVKALSRSAISGGLRSDT